MHTKMSAPASRRAAISSASHSPPLGRAIVLSLPRPEVATVKIVALMAEMLAQTAAPSEGPCSPASGVTSGGGGRRLALGPGRALNDKELLFHGFTPYMRDYEMVVYEPVDPGPKYGLVPRHLRFLFRYCGRERHDTGRQHRVPGAQANAAPFGVGSCRVGRHARGPRTSMRDLLFANVGDAYPWAVSVRVSWSDGVFEFSLVRGGLLVTTDRCRADE